jgi:hypothetical protein
MSAARMKTFSKDIPITGDYDRSNDRVGMV